MRAFFIDSVLLDGYEKTGQFGKILALAKEQLAMARKALPPDSPQLAGQLAQYGLFNLETNAYAEAEAAVRECQTIREKVLADSWLTFNPSNNNGLVKCKSLDFPWHVLNEKFALMM